MTENKRVTNKQILDKIDALKVGEEGLNALAIKIVSRMVKLKSMEDWFHHVSKSDASWITSYKDLDISEEYNALGEAAKLMTLLNIYQDDEEYEKCAIIKNRMDEVNKILRKYNK
tara:strand:+ start:326 stop:670 length:345 start_codon:yes stop_codon:yes gene_type:complete